MKTCPKCGYDPCDTRKAFLKLWKEHPGKSVRWYAERLGVSPSWVHLMKKEAGL